MVYAKRRRYFPTVASSEYIKRKLFPSEDEATGAGAGMAGGRVTGEVVGSNQVDENLDRQGALAITTEDYVRGPVGSDLDRVRVGGKEFLGNFFDVNNEDFAANLLVLALTISILVVFIILVVVYLRMGDKKKCNDVTEKAAGSVLVFPANQQGVGPQFVSNNIHFSLPPLNKSASMLELQDEKGESDIDIETSNLLTAAAHNQRSNSFKNQSHCLKRNVNLGFYGLGVIEPSLYRSTLDLDEVQWPEGHIGRLWFSLRYEPSTEKLLVSLLKARNLPSRTVGTVNSCDPLVRLHLIPDERRYLQSKQKKKTCNPYFDETLVFQVSAKDMNDHVLKLIVIDGGRTKRRQELGYVSYALKNLEIGDGMEQQLLKMDLEKEAQEIKSDLGELLLSLVYNEHLNRLTATIIEARKLKGDKHDVYVRLTLHQHYRSVKEKRTAIVRPGRDGACTFSEGFTFKLAPGQVDVTNLAFHVFQATSGYGRDKLIGKCVLGSYMFARGKALIQWNTAIANPMEQNQQWHTLNE